MTTGEIHNFRKANTEDAVAIDAFLMAYATTSMFLRANLAAYGTQDRASPHGTTFYVADTDAAIRAVFGITNSGYVMAQAPDASGALWTEFAAQVSGRSVRGVTGVPAQVKAGLAALGVSEGPWQVNGDEPLYHLNIAQMDCEPVSVRRAVGDDLALLETWFNVYEQDVGYAPAGSVVTPEAKARAARAIGSPDVVLLEHDGAPVAMAGINARLPDIVQIGGVYTPESFRGHGFARRALAGLLRDCAAQGVTQSVLCANNVPAARAYEALGYREVGQYRTCLLQTPTLIGETS